jgi:hypothetical protein
MALTLRNSALRDFASGSGMKAAASGNVHPTQTTKGNIINT